VGAIVDMFRLENAKIPEKPTNDNTMF